MSSQINNSCKSKSLPASASRDAIHLSTQRMPSLAPDFSWLAPSIPKVALSWPHWKEMNRPDPHPASFTFSDSCRFSNIAYIYQENLAHRLCVTVGGQCGANTDWEVASPSPASQLGSLSRAHWAKGGDEGIQSLDKEKLRLNLKNLGIHPSIGASQIATACHLSRLILHMPGPPDHVWGFCSPFLNVLRNLYRNSGWLARS